MYLENNEITYSCDRSVHYHVAAGNEDLFLCETDGHSIIQVLCAYLPRKNDDYDFFQMHSVMKETFLVRLYKITIELA